jgi:hypothetical protein
MSYPVSSMRPCRPRIDPRRGRKRKALGLAKERFARLDQRDVDTQDTLEVLME